MVYLSCALICQIFCFSFPTVAWPISPLGPVRLQRPGGERKKREQRGCKRCSHHGCSSPGILELSFKKTSSLLPMDFIKTVYLQQRGAPGVASVATPPESPRARGAPLESADRRGAKAPERLVKSIFLFTALKADGGVGLGES